MRAHPLSPDQVEARFWARVDQSGGPDACWPWTGATDRIYGQVYLYRGSTRAHRLAYELVVGPIPSGLVIDHLCRNTMCANPAHLEAVTDRVNVLRGEGISARNARKTTCKRGHDDWVASPSRPGHRRCRQCSRLWGRENRPRTTSRRWKQLWS